MKTRIISSISIDQAHENDIEELLEQLRIERPPRLAPIAIRMLMAVLLCDNWVLLK